MQREIEVSVIVPIYNVEKYLSQCMESILQQTYQKMEIILVDDGSTDKSREICDEFANKDSRVRVFHKKNEGLVSSWIFGTEQSRGQYLCYVDSDDWIDPEMIEQLAEVTTGNSHEMVCSNILLEFETTKIEKKNQLQAGVYEGDELREILKNRVLGNEERLIMASRCTKLISRKLIEDNIKYCDRKIQMGEDLNIILPALLDCERLVIMNRCFYHYRQHDYSMIHTYNKNMYEDLCFLASTIYHILEKKEIETAKTLACKEYYFFLIFAVKNELSGNGNFENRLMEICTEKKNAEIIKEQHPEIKSLSSKLIAIVMRHPRPVYWKILKKVMIRRR